MPLQFLSVFFFISLLLPPTFSTSLIAKPGCQDRCGDLPIPYPFGVGSNCSLHQYFDITCVTTSTDSSPKAYLSYMNKEVIEINRTYIRVKNPYMISACYDLSDYRPRTGINITAEPYQHSMSVNLSGSPYTLSYLNKITAIGCDETVLVFENSNRNAVIGGCSAFCADKNDEGGVGYCPYNATSPANGCCQSAIYRDTGILGAQLIDVSGNLQRKKLFSCSYAFIQESMNVNETSFSYPLYYLDNSTTLLNDNWATTTRPPVVRLDWMVGAENCAQAQNSNNYACRDEKSVCFDVDNTDHRGYLCSCVSGYEGNPYMLGGCQPISFSSSIAKDGCQERCGNLLIPFPFGVGKNCYREPSFEIICNTNTNPPKAYLPALNVEVIKINSSKILVNYPHLGFACYDLSDNQRGINKTKNRSLIIDLSKTQYTLSDENWITVIGCDDMVLGIVRLANGSSVYTSCTSVCWDRQLIYPTNFGYCPYGTNRYLSSDGCCTSPILKGSSYLEANLSDLSGRWPRTNFSFCSYAFIELKNKNPRAYPILNDSTRITGDNAGTFLDTYSWPPLLALDWRIGAVNCSEAQRNLTTYACKANTDCIDFDATVGGYLCNCSKGFQGNAYLTPGCHDINECADNPCHPKSSCTNTLGSFHCACPKGYFGDGRKDGDGCIQLPESKSKTIILIGMSSGLGFLVLLLMCFWLYKVLQKKKEKMLKEKFFKRNGGLLLQQQTNEGTLGKTKVFPSKELEIATDHFNESRILGQGGQGTVYKGMLSDGKIVAIKKSKLVEENQLEQFINEVVILSQINHRNVVKLLGCCLETEVPLLVYEFIPNGTLFDLIHDPNNEFPFPWNMRLKIAADIAGALAYLHSASSMAIYHRDIKSSNILLDEKYVVKVSDFGTSRSIAADQTHLTTMVKGTFGYLDPEYFQSSQFTEKSDVYSFGVVLVELLTGQRPISFDKTEEERGLATRFLTSMEENLLNTILDPQVSEQGRKDEVIVVARLAKRCLNLKGKMRPTVKQVATELESFRISLMSNTIKDGSEEVINFEDIPTPISDIEYTWTASYNKSDIASASDTHPSIITMK